jgi:hypothetical protein
MHAPSYAPLDKTLELLAGCGIELNNGNSNHAPMVAEALCALGRPDAVAPWIARYRQRMLSRPPATGAIRREDWRRALGTRRRFTDWAEFFYEELEQAPWQEALDRWVARLAPGFCAAATHGAIRVGHAVRSLTIAETPWRLRELADALASWTATYRELPVASAAVGPKLPPRQAIIKVPVIPAERRKQGNITASLAALDEFPAFASVIDLIDAEGDLDELLAELTEVFAGVYLANARDRLTTIVFIHGVTSLAALGAICPHTSEGTARSALRFAWQSGCALYACFGGGAPQLPEDIEPRQRSADQLIDQAVANGDEHVIKFAEACLRRRALAPSPVYLAAANHALDVMAAR